MPNSKKPRPLSAKQQSFVESYFTCGWNATEAARRAGYSAKTAQEQGSRLLSNVVVRAQIDVRLKEQAMGADEVLARLSGHARGSVEDFLDDKGGFSLSAGRASGKLFLVKELEQTQRTEYLKDGNPVTIVTTKFKIHDPQTALVHIGRARAMFTDKIAPVDPTGQEEYGHYTDEELRKIANANTSPGSPKAA